MSNDARQAQQKRKTLWGTLFSLPFQVAAIVVVSLLTSIVIEWAGIYWQWWSEPGSEHARLTLESEIRWLDASFTRSIIMSNPIEMTTLILDLAYEWVFVKTGIAPWLESRSSMGGMYDYIRAAIFVTLMTLVRVLILVMTIPLFVMAALVGFIDGLVQRDLRRFGAGRESAFIYHHAKRTVGPTFIIGWLLYLSVPISVHPNWFLLPNAILFGLVISIASRSFKKYL